MSPPWIDYIPSKQIYEVKISNYYDYDISFGNKIVPLDNIDPAIANRLNITPYTKISQPTVVVPRKSSVVITLFVDKIIENIATPLYGSLQIITHNKIASQATIDQGISVPIYKFTNTESADLQVSNVKFDRDITGALSSKLNINYTVTNTGDNIIPLFGQHSILGANDERLYSKEISTAKNILYPKQSTQIKDQLEISDLANIYKLQITIADKFGLPVISENKNILSISIAAIALGLIAVWVITYLFLKKEKIFRFIIFSIDRDRSQKVLVKIASTILVIACLMPSVMAQSLQGTIYRIPESDFSSGTLGTGSSHLLVDSQGGSINSTGSTYGTTDGSLSLYLPSVPPAPTVSNNSGVYYDRLLVTLNITGLPTDLDYAVLVSSASFTNTTGVKYVNQFNTLSDTATSSPVSPADNNNGWRKYGSGSPNWGSTSGTLVTGLKPATSYTFYIKARQRYTAGCTTTSCNIPASETRLVLTSGTNPSPNTTGTTAGTTLAFSILGVTAGGINTVTSTSSSVDFGILTTAASSVASNTLRVTTNAQSGYKINMYTNQKLTRTGGSQTIDWFTGTFASPTTWSAPVTPTTGWIGYAVSTFTAGTYAGFVIYPTTDQIINISTPQMNVAQDNNITYQIQINASQPAGRYTGMTITYLLTGSF